MLIYKLSIRAVFAAVCPLVEMEEEVTVAVTSSSMTCYSHVT